MRDIRYNAIGLIFVLVLIINFVFSNVCYETMRYTYPENFSGVLYLCSPNYIQYGCYHGIDLLRDNSTFAIIVGIGGLLASPGFGYIFSSIVMLFFNLWGGYSRLLKERLGEIDKKYLKKFKSKCTFGSVEYSKIFEYYSGKKSFKLKSKLELPLFEGPPNYDEFFTYFWQKEDPLILEWTVRRWDIFFTNISIILAILVAEILFYLMIITDIFFLAETLSFKVTTANYAIFIIALAFMIVLAIEAIRTKDEAINMIKLNLLYEN